MALAVDAANARNPLWQSRALESLRRYLDHMNGQLFLTEQFREWAETHDNLPTPPSGRAYGAVMTTASKQKLIEPHGYTRTSNPKAHRTPATLWRDALPF